MEPMEVYIANIPFDKRNGSNFRPALVIEVERKLIVVFKVTSHYQNKSAQIKRLYYPIQMWREARLKKRSYVETHKLYRLNKNWVFSQRPIGKLTELDSLGLFSFIKQQN